MKENFYLVLSEEQGLEIVTNLEDYMMRYNLYYVEITRYENIDDALDGYLRVNEELHKHLEKNK